MYKVTRHDQSENTMLLAMLTGFIVLAASPAFAELEWRPSAIAQWEREVFKGTTSYSLVAGGERDALHARCKASASGLFLKQTIDLKATPILEWTWRVDSIFAGGADEKSRVGDDFAARIYVVKDGGLLPWQTRAINYVWSSTMPEGSDWPNPYAAQARMIALRSGPPPKPGTWRTERRNVRSDFLRYHGIELSSIDAVAIMTDCDDRRTTAEAWYGTIRFLPK
jgi:hypothetical protein